MKNTNNHITKILQKRDGLAVSESFKNMMIGGIISSNRIIFQIEDVIEVEEVVALKATRERA